MTFYQSQKFLRKEKLPNLVASDLLLFSMIPNFQNCVFSKNLSRRVNHIGPKSCFYFYSSFGDGPALFIVTKNIKPNYAIKNVEATRFQSFGNAIEVLKKLLIRFCIERAKQNIRQIRLQLSNRKIIHIRPKELHFHSVIFGARFHKIQHFSAQIQPKVFITTVMPFLHIRAISRSQFKNFSNFDFRKFLYRLFKKVNLIRYISKAKGDVIVFRIFVESHIRNFSFPKIKMQLEPTFFYRFFGGFYRPDAASLKNSKILGQESTAASASASALPPNAKSVPSTGCTEFLTVVGPKGW